MSHLHGLLVYDETGRILWDIAYSLGDNIEALEVTSKDELLALFSDGEVAKLVLLKP